MTGSLMELEGKKEASELKTSLGTYGIHTESQNWAFFERGEGFITLPRRGITGEVDKGDKRG